MPIIIRNKQPCDNCPKKPKQKKSKINDMIFCPDCMKVLSYQIDAKGKTAEEAEIDITQLEIIETDESNN